MNIRLVLIIGLVGSTVSGSHLDLTTSKKIEFVKKRLEMMKADVALKTGTLLMLQKRLDSVDASHIDRLKNELIQLKESIPVIERSLEALGTLRNETRTP